MGTTKDSFSAVNGVRIRLYEKGDLLEMGCRTSENFGWLSCVLAVLNLGLF